MSSPAAGSQLSKPLLDATSATCQDLLKKRARSSLDDGKQLYSPKSKRLNMTDAVWGRKLPPMEGEHDDNTSSEEDLCGHNIRPSIADNYALLKTESPEQDSNVTPSHWGSGHERVGGNYQMNSVPPTVWPTKPGIPTLSLSPTGAAMESMKGDHIQQSQQSRLSRGSSDDDDTWSWVGSAMKDPHFLNEQIMSDRHLYYKQAKSIEGNFTLSLGDAVLLKTDADEASKPYIARIRGFCEDVGTSEGGKYVIIEWFFRPEEMKGGREPWHGKDEVFLKKSGIQVRVYHIECIESPCRVVTYPVYCRIRAEEKAREANGMKRMSSSAIPLYFAREWHDNEDNYKSVFKKKRVGGDKSDKRNARPAIDSLYNALNINKRNIKGETKLHAACIRGNVEEVRHLIRMNASCDVSDHAGWTPLHEACARNHIEIARLLIRHRVDVNVVGPTGTMPIHDAAANQNLEIIQLLVRNGAWTKVPDADGKLPMDLAGHNPNIVEVLEKQRGRRAAALACELSNALTSVQSYQAYQ